MGRCWYCYICTSWNIVRKVKTVGMSLDIYLNIDFVEFYRRVWNILKNILVKLFLHWLSVHPRDDILSGIYIVCSYTYPAFGAKKIPGHLRLLWGTRSKSLIWDTFCIRFLRRIMAFWYHLIDNDNSLILYSISDLCVLALPPNKIKNKIIINNNKE